MNKNIKAYFHITLVIIAWAISPVLFKLLVRNLSPLQIVFYILLFAVISSFVMIILQGKIKILKKYSRKDYLIFLLMGFIGIFIYHLIYVYGFKLLPAAEVNTLNYTWPIFVIIFASVILKEKLTIRKIIAIVIGFIGIYIIIGKGFTTFTNLLGDFIIIFSAAMWALFSILGKRLKYDKYVSMSMYFLFGFILTTFVSFLFSSFAIPTFTQLLYLLFMGVISRTLAFTSWFRALELGDTARIANISFLTPFVSFVFINWILGETIFWYYIASLILIVLGIFIQRK